MLNRLKISLILAPVALIMLIGVYVYSLWSQERKRSSEIPVDATASMNRDLVKFHQKRGSFPATLKDLEGVVWEKKDRNYVSDGHSMIHRNYFYLYSRIDQNRFTLWAIPVGKEREEASTFFLVGTPMKKRTWKGAALTVEDVGKLPRLLPIEQDLALRGMFEQVDHKAVYSNSK